MKRIMTLVAASLCGGALVYGCSSSSNNATGGNDAGSQDGSTTDVVGHKEAAPQSDSGGDDSSSSTCPTPADLSTWKPPSYVPAKTSPGACTATVISGYDAACYNQTTGSTAACKAFQTANAACTACLQSKSTDATWGLLISWGGVVNLNLGGCLQLEAPSESACALSQEVAIACVHAACDTVCPVTSGNQASFTQWQACEMTANTDACGTYATQANCLATDDAATGTICDPGSGATFESLFLQLAPLFCGSTDGGSGEAGTTEGGTDSGAADAPGG